MGFPGAASVGAVSAATATTLAVAGPASAGNYQIAILACSTGSETLTLPTVPPGWTLRADLTITSPGTPDRGGTGKVWVLSQDTPSTASQTFTKSGTRRLVGQRISWASVTSATYPSATPTAAATATNAVATHTTAALTPAANTDTKLVGICVVDLGPAALVTMTPPAAPAVTVTNTVTPTPAASESEIIAVSELSVAGTASPTAQTMTFTTSDVEEAFLLPILLNGTASAAPVPVVTAGADASVVVNTAFTRTGTGTNSPTSWSWTVLSGPAQVGATIGTAAALSWTPATVGAYVLRLTATNASGTSTPDDVAVTVTAAPTAPTVGAGADVASHPVSTAFTRTATESDGGSAITSRAWTLVSAPAGVTTGSVGTTATLSYTPTVVGAYTFRYTATNAIGTSTPDDMVLTVDSTRPPGTGTVTQQWLGLDSVVVKTSGGSAVQVAFSTSSTMSSRVYSTDGTKTPDASGVTKHVMPALTADTPYWYQVESGGGPIGTAQAFRTLPGSGAQNFTFGFSSCRDHVDNFPDVNPTALADMATRGVDFFLEVGDFHYRDINTNDQAAFRTAYDELFTRSNIANTLKSIPTGYVWDDHDYGGDSSNGNTASRPAAQAVYRERVPHPTLPSATGGIYHTFVVGRVRFIMLDLRSFRSPVGNADDANKTMLGAEQKTWLQNLLNTSTEPMTVIVSSVGWIGAAGVDSGQDHWAYYTNERAQVGAWITANAAKTKCIFISGDAHMLAYDDGTNSVAGAPAYHAAALNQSTSTKGGPYSGGSRASSNAYGYVSIADTGSQISFTYSGYYDGGTLWKSHTTTATSSTPVTVTAAASAPLGGLTATATTAPKLTMFDAVANVQGGQTSIPLTVGTNGQAGDLRIVRAACPTSRILGETPAGWTKIYDDIAAPASRRVAIFTRTLTGGDTDASVEFGDPAGRAYTAITLRGWDVTQTLAPDHAGSTSTATAIVAPSVTTGPGALLTWHDVTNVAGNANTSTLSVPDGMTQRAFSASDDVNGFNVLLSSEARTAGASGTRTSTASTAATWSATSLFVQEASTVTVSATATGVLGGLTAAAAATVVAEEILATASATLGGLAANAAAGVAHSATAAATLGALVAVAAATVIAEEITATASAALGGLTATASAEVTAEVIEANADAPLGTLAATAAATVTRTAAASAPLGPLTAAADATVTAEEITAVGSVNLGPLTAAADGIVVPPNSAVAAADLGSLQATAIATTTRTAAATAPLGQLTGAGIARVDVISTATAPLGGLTAQASAGGSLTATAAATLGGLEATAAASVTTPAPHTGPIHAGTPIPGAVLHAGTPTSTTSIHAGPLTPGTTIHAGVPICI